MSNTAQSVLDVARAEIGYSRWTDPNPGTKYGRWYAEKVADAYYGTSGVPFCAMFVSWVFDRAGARCAGLPEAYCPYIVSKAKAAGKAVAVSAAKPGDVVLFDWDGGVSDHVGIVESNGGSALVCIEGNTDGGKVARRTRAYSTVCLVVRPDYDGAAPEPAQTPTARLDVDGWLGVRSVTAWQEALGTHVDGFVSGQSDWDRQYLPNLVAVTYDDGGSRLVQAVQRKVGADVDGYMGPQTVRCLQAWLNGQGGYGLAMDGYLGPMTAKAVQQAINGGKWV